MYVSIRSSFYLESNLTQQQEEAEAAEGMVVEEEEVTEAVVDIVS